jgi:DMSO/TMAO reductase YedYZ molybdopterin-dependent catalytic subunit
MFVPWSTTQTNNLFPLEAHVMPKPQISRRDVIRNTLTSAMAGLAMMGTPDFTFAGQEANEELVPFQDEPPTKPDSLNWEKLTKWLTPQDQVFSIQHYGIPDVKAAAYELEISGLIDHPRKLSINDLKSLPHRDQFMTLECSGNGSAPKFMNAVYNSRWTGTPLVPILKECGIKPGANEVVFFGDDRQAETLRKGTPRELTVEVPFGRSLSLDDTMHLNPLLAYERDGVPLEKRNGAPLRLIVPGWYGIACVKWLRRIEVRDRRFMNRFMGRDYVTVRGERHGGEVVFVESSVTRMNLKSVVARVTRRATKDDKIPLKAYGAVWGDGTPIKKVEVQLDNSEWREATLDEQPLEKYSWRFFSIDLGAVAPGKHTVVSRAIDEKGRIQPTAQDDEIALKKTYWEAYQQWPRVIDVKA